MYLCLKLSVYLIVLFQNPLTRLLHSNPTSPSALDSNGVRVFVLLYVLPAPCIIHLLDEHVCDPLLLELLV